MVAFFGEQAVMLSPTAPDLWTGHADISVLTQSGKNISLKVSGMDGQTAQLRLANFSAGTIKNFSSKDNTLGNHVDIFSFSFDAKSFESRFYLLFIAAVLACLILAIAIKRHIQHVSLIANGSFVAIFATLMFWAG